MMARQTVSCRRRHHCHGQVTWNPCLNQNRPFHPPPCPPSSSRHHHCRRESVILEACIHSFHSPVNARPQEARCSIRTRLVHAGLAVRDGCNGGGHHNSSRRGRLLREEDDKKRKKRTMLNTNSLGGTATYPRNAAAGGGLSSPAPPPPPQPPPRLGGGLSAARGSLSRLRLEDNGEPCGDSSAAAAFKTLPRFRGPLGEPAAAEGRPDLSGLSPPLPLLPALVVRSVSFAALRAALRAARSGSSRADRDREEEEAEEDF